MMGFSTFSYRQALHIEHACLVHVPPPVLRLAKAPGSALRELRLHCCQIRQLPSDACADLAGLTSLQLSGAPRCAALRCACTPWAPLWFGSREGTRTSGVWATQLP